MFTLRNQVISLYFNLTLIFSILSFLWEYFLTPSCSFKFCFLKGVCFQIPLDSISLLLSKVCDAISNLIAFFFTTCFLGMHAGPDPASSNQVRSLPEPCCTFLVTCLLEWNFWGEFKLSSVPSFIWDCLSHDAELVFTKFLRGPQELWAELWGDHHTYNLSFSVF